MTSIRALRACVAPVVFSGLPAQAQSIAEPSVALRGKDVFSCFQAGGPVRG